VGGKRLGSGLDPLLKGEEVIEFLVAVIFCLFYLLILERYTIVLQRRRIKELEKRPVGQIISAELTDSGLLMKGELWDEAVKTKIAQDVIGLSIGPFKGETKWPDTD
jgi:hypothetical protein